VGKIAEKAVCKSVFGDFAHWEEADNKKGNMGRCNKGQQK